MTNPLGLKVLKTEYKHQCYRAAFDCAIELAQSGVVPVVCHGPVNGSHACEGLRFDHAWTEV
jgi:inosine/xanthosine triphosphate pyrophosphatase family protein